MLAIMHVLALPSLFVASTIQVHAYLPAYEDAQMNSTYSSLLPRESPPEIPSRPPTSGPGSFHGSQFLFLEQTGFAPAVDAMHVRMYSRTQKEFVRRALPSDLRARTLDT